MISIILVTYNMADYLDRCITSIINQTYKDLEVIIVNDGSTDNTSEILNKYQKLDSRITVINQENKGHSESRNVGMKNATSNYYFFIDADDYIHPQTIQTLWDNMQNTGADISIGNIERKTDLAEKLDNNCDVLTPVEALSILVDYSTPIPIQKLPFNVTWNKIFKAELFDDIKFPTGRLRDDNFTCHRLLYKANKIAYTTAKTYYYTYKEHSMSTDGLYKNTDLILAHNDRIKFFKEKGLTDLLSDECSLALGIYLKTFFAMKSIPVLYEARQFVKDNEKYFSHNVRGLNHIKELNSIFDIIIYVDELRTNTGVSNWVLNFCKALNQKYSILVLSGKFVKDSDKIFSKYVLCKVWKPGKTYNCGTLIYNFPYNSRPNIISCNTYVILHCDYGNMEREILFDKSVKYITLCNTVHDGMLNKYNIDSEVISSFMPEFKKKRVYRFISATRLKPEKGISRMLQLCEILKRNDICFQWLIFCENDIRSMLFESNYPELIYGGEQSNETILQYMSDCDYVIQLTDYNVEGFCYAVHESLMVGTPVIVTDIPIFKDVVKNGYNGYRIPLDMESINLEQILCNIPKDFVYEKDESNVGKWEDVLK